MINVLVVDDIGIMRHTIKDHITKLGHHVVAEASNGDEAISLYKRLKPTIVTMDIAMPAFNGILSGIDALRQIKEFDKDAKVIMITSHGESELIREAIHLGAKGYILKPVTQDKLEAMFLKLHE
jgi:two-component system, chemotaxis family, chemotaxis protein CheY